MGRSADSKPSSEEFEISTLQIIQGRSATGHADIFEAASVTPRFSSATTVTLLTNGNLISSACSFTDILRIINAGCTRATDQNVTVNCHSRHCCKRCTTNYNTSP